MNISCCFRSEIREDFTVPVRRLRRNDKHRRGNLMIDVFEYREIRGTLLSTDMAFSYSSFAYHKYVKS